MEWRVVAIPDFAPYAVRPPGKPSRLEGVRLATVDGDAGSDHPRCAWRHHERDHVGDLVHGSEAPERQLALDERRHPTRVLPDAALPASSREQSRSRSDAEHPHTIRC